MDTQFNTALASRTEAFKQMSEAQLCKSWLLDVIQEILICYHHVADRAGHLCEYHLSAGVLPLTSYVELVAASTLSAITHSEVECQWC